jgi:hypothetical protein
LAAFVAAGAADFLGSAKNFGQFSVVVAKAFVWRFVATWIVK